jgi:hypothetical protein
MSLINLIIKFIFNQNKIVFYIVVNYLIIIKFNYFYIMNDKEIE